MPPKIPAGKTASRAKTRDDKPVIARATPVRTPSIRITGGAWRSRVLNAPADQNVTRPTMDQTRQAIFNILNSAAWAMQPNGQTLLLNAYILDGFAGSGAYAFEALSRGVAHATVIDKHKESVAACEKNAESLKCDTQTKIMRIDMMALPAKGAAPVTLCFLDPPYDFTDWPHLLQHLQHRGWIDATTLLILEANSKQAREFNASLEGVVTVHDQRRYGHALVTFGQISVAQTVA